MRNFLGAISTAIGVFLFSLGYVIMDNEGKKMFVEKFSQAIYNVIEDDLPELLDKMAARRQAAQSKSAP